MVFIPNNDSGIRELALFAGAGGGILGAKLLGHRIVCAVEIEPYCREVLLRRQEEGILEAFPIWDDVRTFDGKPWRGIVDCISAGFPCQPFSIAGKRRGADDERNMWPETIRIIGEVRPRYALLENVPGLLVSGYMGRIFGDISELGYDCRWGVIGADDVGAPHRRKRLWIRLFDSDCTTNSRGRGQSRKADSISGIDRTALCTGESGRTNNVDNPDQWGHGWSEHEIQTGRNSAIDASQMAVPEVPRLQGHESAGDTCTGGLPAKCRCTWWDIDPADLPDSESIGRGVRASENDGQTAGESATPCDSNSLPDTEKAMCEQSGRAWTGGEGFTDSDRGTAKSFVGRVAHGVAYRVDRLKAIGNGQVSRVVREAWNRLGGA